VARWVDWRELHQERMRQGEALLVQQAKVSLAYWLDRFPWEWYLTATFRDDVHLGQAYAAWGQFMAWLRGHGGRPSYFRCTEHQQRGTPHFHALLFDVDLAARRMAAVDWWWGHHGMARVLPYDSTRAATDYVSKYVLKEAQRTGDWALEVSRQHQETMRLVRLLPNRILGGGA